MAKIIYLSREAILAADDLPVEEVEVPEWGGTVRLRAPDAFSWQEINAQLKDAGLAEVYVIALASMLVDEHGQPLFSADQVQALARKNFQVVRRLGTIAFRLAGGSRQEVEAIEENFEAPQDGASPSA
ncbi:MAG TPA: hypothetical protein VI776_07240 [Anaerolineales bacterium]|nr:hypothetical protein [Anaerolineales bacterium]